MKILQSTGYGSQQISEVLNTSNIELFNQSRPLEQVYHELAVTLDTRKNRKINSGGARLEAFRVGRASGGSFAHPA